MLKVELIRKELLPNCTLGELFLNNAFECYTLEDAVREVKIPGQTAIPAGRYELVLSWSPRFKRVLPELLGVPNFTGIRIHPGNTAEDTEGCILVGRVKVKEAVLQSRLAFEALFDKLELAAAQGEEMEIEIR